MAESLARLPNNPALDYKTRQGSPLAVPSFYCLSGNLESRQLKCRDKETHQE